MLIQMCYINVPTYAMADIRQRESETKQTPYKHLVPPKPFRGIYRYGDVIASTPAFEFGQDVL